MLQHTDCCSVIPADPDHDLKPFNHFKALIVGCQEKIIVIIPYTVP